MIPVRTESSGSNVNRSWNGLPLNVLRAMEQRTPSSNSERTVDSESNRNSVSNSSNSGARALALPVPVPPTLAIDRPSMRYREYDLEPSEGRYAARVAIALGEAAREGLVDLTGRGRAGALWDEAKELARHGLLRRKALHRFVAYTDALISTASGSSWFERVADDVQPRAQARRDAAVHQQEVPVHAIGRRAMLTAAPPVLMLKNAAGVAADAEARRLQEISAAAASEVRTRRLRAAELRRAHQRVRALSPESFLDRFDEISARSDTRDPHVRALIRNYERRFINR